MVGGTTRSRERRVIAGTCAAILRICAAVAGTTGGRGSVRRDLDDLNRGRANANDAAVARTTPWLPERRGIARTYAAAARNYAAIA
jgi:hypothetical protein